MLYAEGAKHTGSHPLPHSLPLHRVPPMEAEDSTGLVLGAGECQAHCSVPLAGRGWGPSTPRVEESARRDPGRAGSEIRTGDDEEGLLYKIRRGCPILGHKDRTHPPQTPPSGKPILGLPRTRPYSLRETLLPSSLPWGPGEAGAAPLRRRGRADRTPMAPALPREQQPHPHASSPSPPPPLPHSGLKDTSQHNRYRQGGLLFRKWGL